MNKLKVFIFDLDDTLYPEIQYVWSGFRAVSRMLSSDEKVQEEIFNILTKLFRENKQYVFDRFLEKLLVKTDEYLIDVKQNLLHKVKDEIINEMLLCYRQHDPQISLYEEVPYILDYLSVRRVRLGIITDGYWEVQKRKVKRLGLEKWMELIIYTDILAPERRYWKPSPYAFQKALDYYGVSANSICYIGDNPAKDFYGPASLSMKTIWIRRPDGIYQDLTINQDLRVDLEIETLHELLSLI